MEKARHWPGNESNQQQDQNRRQAQPPCEPLRGYTQNNNTSQTYEYMMIQATNSFFAKHSNPIPVTKSNQFSSNITLNGRTLKKAHLFCLMLDSPQGREYGLTTVVMRLAESLRRNVQ